MGEGGEGVRRKGRLSAKVDRFAGNSPRFSDSALRNERPPVLLNRRPRESGDPAAFVQKTLDSRFRGNDDIKNPSVTHLRNAQWRAGFALLLLTRSRGPLLD